MKNLQTFDEHINEAKTDDMAKIIAKAISKVDDSLHYEDFAIAVADIIKDDYGTHNIEPFMKVLHKELGLK